MYPLANTTECPTNVTDCFVELSCDFLRHRSLVHPSQVLVQVVDDGLGPRLAAIHGAFRSVCTSCEVSRARIPWFLRLGSSLTFPRELPQPSFPSLDSFPVHAVTRSGRQGPHLVMKGWLRRVCHSFRCRSPVRLPLWARRPIMWRVRGRWYRMPCRRF